MAYTNGYGAYSQKENVSRFQLRVPKKIMDEIDDFGIPEGFRSRNAAIIYLLKFALEQKKAAGPNANQTPAASKQ